MTRGSRIPVWLDCDPGHDDAVAILLGCFHPSFKLIGISASYGNAPPDKTLNNALSLLTAMGKADEVPVYKGSQQPWYKLPEYAPDIHGESGLDGTTLLPAPAAQHCQEHYLDAMERAILSHAGEITLVSTGSLTSIATLFRDRPHLKEHVRYVSIMGGGIEEGNRNKNNTAEFNIWVDPHAANSIFKDQEVSHKCILIPLDLTHKAIATQEVVKNVLGNGSLLRKLFYELFLFFSETYKNVQGFESGAPVHDPLTLNPLLYFYEHVPNETLQFSYRRYDLRVEEGKTSPDEGRIIVTAEHSVDAGKGTIVGLSLNYEYFWYQLYNALEKAESYINRI